MPKDRRKRQPIHASSAKSKTHQTEEVLDVALPADLANNPMPDVRAIGETHIADDARPTASKKEKLQIKREAFMQKLQIGSISRGSKSHVRREKRKARERLAGGELNEIQSAIIALDDEPANNDSHSTEGDQKKQSLKPGMIGEGRKATLSAAQRRRTLQLEQARQPLILSNPQFAANPFQAIRTHAKNTLVKHQIPS